MLFICLDLVILFVCLHFAFGLFSMYTFVVSNILLRVPKDESDFQCTQKVDRTDY